jgi:hypothetical protein
LLNKSFINSAITNIYNGRKIVKTLLVEYLKILKIINIDKIVDKNIFDLLFLKKLIIDINTIDVKPIPRDEYNMLFVLILGNNKSFRLTITSSVDGVSKYRYITGTNKILEHSKDTKIGPIIDIHVFINVFSVGLYILFKYLYKPYIKITIILNNEYFKLVIKLKNKDIINK